jgi:hypothetical protein
VSRKVRKACDDFTKTTIEYLPKVSPELILDIRKAEKSGQKSDIVNIRYAEGPPLTEKSKDLCEKGYTIIEIGRGDENRYMQVKIPLKIETLFELSKDEDIISIRKATWVP